MCFTQHVKQKMHFGKKIKNKEEYIADSQMAGFLSSFLPNFVPLSSFSNLPASFTLRISSALNGAENLQIKKAFVRGKQSQGCLG